MKPSKDLPYKPNQATELDTPSLTDPKTGKRLKIEYKRADFEEITKRTTRDPDAERAFIEGKMEMVLRDPHLGDEEKNKVIEELSRKHPIP